MSHNSFNDQINVTNHLMAKLISYNSFKNQFEVLLYEISYPSFPIKKVIFTLFTHLFKSIISNKIMIDKYFLKKSCFKWMKFGHDLFNFHIIRVLSGNS